MTNALLGLSLSLVLGLAACGGTIASDGQPQTSASATTKAPVGANTHGPVKMVADALSDVPLRADQRAEIEKIAAEADARQMAAVSARSDLVTALADQVERGAIDHLALQPKIDRSSAEQDKRRPADRAALVRIHELLDAEQRSAFVDALESRLHGSHDDRDDDKAKAFSTFHDFRAFGAALGLTEDQRAQIKDALKDEMHAGRGHGFAEARGHMHEAKQAVESFRTSTFLPDALFSGSTAGIGDLHVIVVSEKVVPILTALQRKAAAEKLRAFAASGAP